MHIVCPKDDNKHQSLCVTFLFVYRTLSTFKILLLNWYPNSLIICLAAKILAFSLYDSITSCNSMKMKSNINKK
jgi:hypothetical protein